MCLYFTQPHTYLNVLLIGVTVIRLCLQIVVLAIKRDNNTSHNAARTETVSIVCSIPNLTCQKPQVSRHLISNRLHFEV